MVHRTIGLSGYPLGDAAGRIEIFTEFLRPEVEDCIVGNQLSWASIRRLDASFRKEISSDGKSNSIYLQNLNFRKHVGLHLCAILTGMKFQLNIVDAQDPPVANGTKFSVFGAVSPILTIVGEPKVTMKFPNPVHSDFGLYHVQMESKFRKWLITYDQHMALSDTASTPENTAASGHQTLEGYFSQIRATRLFPASTKMI